jgi:hypothetical protein
MALVAHWRLQSAKNPLCQLICRSLIACRSKQVGEHDDGNIIGRDIAHKALEASNLAIMADRPTEVGDVSRIEYLSAWC